jgi:hypothetical protein
VTAYFFVLTVGLIAGALNSIIEPLLDLQEQVIMTKSKKVIITCADDFDEVRRKRHSF